MTERGDHASRTWAKRSGIIVIGLAMTATACMSVVARNDGVTVRGEGGGFVQLGPQAQEWADATFHGEALGQPIVVHYTSDRLDEPTARRFVEQLGAYQAELEQNFERLRTGLVAHLGPELGPRIDGFEELATPELPGTWYLLARPRPTLVVWNIPGANYHFLDPDAGTYTDEELQPARYLGSQVHSRMHRVFRGLLTSRRGWLPRWIEEGMCDYTSMQYQRWVEHRFDGAREVMARLTWQREPVQRQMKDWKHSGLSQLHEANWEGDFLYQGSLGLVFAIESELGSAGLVELLRELILLSPETDRQVVELIEARTGKPLSEVGRMSPEARQALSQSLITRARTACSTAEPAAEQDRESESSSELPLAALGHFPEAASEIEPLLEELARCPRQDVAVEGLAGLRYLGGIDTLRRVLADYPKEAAPGWSLRLATEIELTRKFSKSAEAARWFAAERRQFAMEDVRASR